MAACEDSEAADQVVETLPGREPSYIEQHRLIRRQAQRPPRKRLSDRPELATIEAARDDRDARIIRPVERREVGPVLRALGDDAVGALDQRLLDRQALERKLVCLALVQTAHAAERVEGDDERRAQPLLQLERREAGHEKVRV